MSDAALPQLPVEELARGLDDGERVQVRDIRAPEKVAPSRVRFGRAPDFRALPASEISRLPSLEPLALDLARPVAVICGHGNSSKQATTFLRQRGVEAYSVTGGMAAWETVYVPRRLTSTPSLQHVVQVDRVGKGALSYVLASQGEAVVVDPGRHVERYDALPADFLFGQSVGRPGLGGQGAAWAKLLWRSLERVRRSWPGELLVLPAHYASERERRADRSVAARFDVIAATNEAAAIQDEQAFLAWVTARTTTPPDAYRTIKLANLGLVDVTDADAEILELGPNACAIG